VKLNAVGGAFQAVMREDGDVTSAFFLQHSGADQRLAFSFVGVRALANTVGQPVADQWQHLVGVRHVEFEAVDLRRRRTPGLGGHPRRRRKGNRQP
jgi:hypothetical protein